jgi:HD-like signal output (HDOD) protein
MSSIDLQTLLKEATELEPMPATATRLAALLGQEDWHLNEIVEVVELDQALTGRLLSLANSVAGGSLNAISSISDAVMRSGPGMVLSLSMAPVVRQQLHRPLSAYGLSEGELWRHSVAAALAVKLAAEHCGTPAPPQSFAAALLHDVGKLVLDRHLQTVASSDGGVEPIVLSGSSEKERFGIDHNELGGFVANHWKLPGGISVGVRFHQDPDRAPDESGRRIASFVALANAVTYQIGAGCGQGQRKLTMETVKRIGLTREGFVGLCRATIALLEETLAAYK